MFVTDTAASGSVVELETLDTLGSLLPPPPVDEYGSGLVGSLAGDSLADLPPPPPLDGY